MGGSGKSGYITGPLQTIAGAGLTYMGMPELGVPLLTAGVGQTAGTAAGHPGAGELAGAAVGGGVDVAGSAGALGPLSQGAGPSLGAVGKDIGSAINTPMGTMAASKALSSPGAPPSPAPPAPPPPKPPSPVPVNPTGPTVTKAAGPGAAPNNQLTPQQLAMLRQMGGNTNPWAVS